MRRRPSRRDRHTASKITMTRAHIDREDGPLTLALTSRFRAHDDDQPDERAATVGRARPLADD